ncbi:olfactory receptor 5V1-like [Ambystoma mexicanum]|uniref:olfactory receptor 5V1-like n=1 Tax=Ambystoma mexicanum TaxID=8296 RepID=UPI0037E7898D
MENVTRVDEFVLLGLTNIPELQAALFMVFLVFYLATILGNFTIITVSWVEPSLHSPMYFFIANLSFLDLCYSTATVPKMLDHFLVERKTMSFVECALQMLFFMSFAGTEALLLAAMAYDRYVAICHPLRYTSIISRRVCAMLVSGSWIAGLVDSMVHTILAFRLSFCGSRTINHFFCDIVPVLQLSCSSTYFNQIVLLALGALIGMSSFALTLTSYVKIVCAILKINSTEGRSKAFSTCSSHLLVVILFYVTIMSTYLRPGSSSELEQNSQLAILYAVVTPLLNPFIFSLRNKAVKEALWRVVAKKRVLT